jgi:hypothetical protein
MEENEELVTDVTENVEEQPTEEVVEGNVEPTNEEIEQVSEPIKTYTDAEVDEIIKKKLYRQEQKLTREFNKQMSSYKRAEEVLNAGLGTSNIEEATSNLAKFYKEKGITIPDERPNYNEFDMEAGAEKEAKSIIDSGYEDIVEETNRLAELGLDNMSKRDKIIFSVLSSEREKIENEKEIASLGVPKEELESNEFKTFSNKYPSLSLKDKYELYSQLKPRKNENKMGSMKNMAASKVKDYYSLEEISKLSEDDLNDPQIWNAVRNSMTKDYKSY